MCPEWIPRGQNQTADDLCRCGDSDDWSVSNLFFSELNLKLGPHTIDRFASMHNANCRRFLRFNKISELQCNDIEFKEDHDILKVAFHFHIFLVLIVLDLLLKNL